jgi:hypothetical protein
VTTAEGCAKAMNGRIDWRVLGISRAGLREKQSDKTVVQHVRGLIIHEGEPTCLFTAFWFGLVLARMPRLAVLAWSVRDGRRPGDPIPLPTWPAAAST